MYSSMIRPSTVLFGKDNEAIPLLLEIHCAVKNPKILDCTYNTGKIWKGIKEKYDITTMDINPEFGTDVVGDFRNMPFEDGSFDVIVFDPPHLPVAVASVGSSTLEEIQQWRKNYGLTSEKGMGRDGDNVSEIFVPFLLEAKRVLRPDGIVLCKLSDLVHNHRYQWQQVDFINAVRIVGGMTPCDMLIKVDPCAGNLKSSKWQNVKHLRKGHSYWIVVRNSTRCERP